jgi:hypothetical protein
MNDFFKQVVFVSFGTTPEWSQAHFRLKKTIRKNFPSASIFFQDQNWLKSTNFFIEHSDFFVSHGKGFGLWLWKPFVIKEALSQFNQIKYIIYIDAGVELNITELSLLRLTEYFQIVEKTGALAFRLNLLEKDFTSPILFSKLDKIPSIHHQISASVICFKNNNTTFRFVSEWLNKMILNDYELTLGYNAKHKEIFKNHRHDQSILSLLWSETSFTALEDETFFENDWSKGHNYPFWVARNRLNVSIKSNSALRLVFRLSRRLSMLLQKIIK